MPEEKSKGDSQHAQPEGVSEHAGFPNPATDTSLRTLNLNDLLIAHSASTYLFRVRGDAWESGGVFDGDIAIIDRALDARKTDTVIWWDNNTDRFSISLCSKVPDDATVWGVITSTIHQLRKVRLDGEE
jgi:hypothetical protein